MTHCLLLHTTRLVVMREGACEWCGFVYKTLSVRVHQKPGLLARVGGRNLYMHHDALQVQMLVCAAADVYPRML